MTDAFICKNNFQHIVYKITPISGGRNRKSAVIALLAGYCAVGYGCNQETAICEKTLLYHKLLATVNNQLYTRYIENRILKKEGSYEEHD